MVGFEILRLCPVNLEGEKYCLRVFKITFLVTTKLIMKLCG